MSLLREIQEGATGTEPLASLLRKAKVLAARLDHQPLRDWVDWELNGYPSFDELPPYRQGGEVPVLGDFGGPFGSGQRNRPLPSWAIKDKDMRKALFEWHFTQGVAAYEDMLTRDQIAFEIPWPSNVVAMYQHEFLDGLVLATARRVISAPEIRQVLDAIRTRLLDLALEIERENPDAGEAPVGQPAIPEERVSQVFNTTIYGGTNNVVTAGRDARQRIDVDVELAGRFDDVRNDLLAAGLSAGEVDELRDALMQDVASGAQNGQVGPATKSWLGGLAVRSAEAGTSATAGIVSGIVLKLLGAS